MYFFNELKRRNPSLYWYGILNFVAAIICLALIPITDVSVNNINAYIKPLKFFISIAIFVWTMGWILFYLDRPLKVRAYNVMAIIIFSYESFVITWQAANGRLSHFNISTPFYNILFQLMGIAITLLTLWTGYICYLFFRKKEWSLPISYVWGLRLGMLFFVVFALEGGIMGAILSHSIGGSDGDKGIPVVNWNRQHGDLRVAHFMGMHALQLLPLFGYYMSKQIKYVIAFSLAYFALVIAVLIEALMGLPLL